MPQANSLVSFFFFFALKRHTHTCLPSEARSFEVTQTTFTVHALCSFGLLANEVDLKKKKEREKNRTMGCGLSLTDNVADSAVSPSRRGVSLTHDRLKNDTENKHLNGEQSKKQKKKQQKQQSQENQLTATDAARSRHTKLKVSAVLLHQVPLESEADRAAQHAQKDPPKKVKFLLDNTGGVVAKTALPDADARESAQLMMACSARAAPSVDIPSVVVHRHQKQAKQLSRDALNFTNTAKPETKQEQPSHAAVAANAPNCPAHDRRAPPAPAIPSSRKLSLPYDTSLFEYDCFATADCLNAKSEAATASTRPPLSGNASPRSDRAAVNHAGGSKRAAVSNDYDLSMFTDSRNSWRQPYYVAHGHPSVKHSSTSSIPSISSSVGGGESLRKESVLDSILLSPSSSPHENTNVKSSLMALTKMPSGSPPPRKLPSAFLGQNVFRLDSYLQTSTDLEMLRRSDEGAMKLSYSLESLKSAAEENQLNKAGAATSVDEVQTDREVEMVPMVKTKTTQSTSSTQQAKVNDSGKQSQGGSKKTLDKETKDDDESSEEGGLVRGSSNLSEVVVGSSMSLLAAMKRRRRTVTIVEPPQRPPRLPRPKQIMPVMRNSLPDVSMHQPPAPSFLSHNNPQNPVTPPGYSTGPSKQLLQQQQQQPTRFLNTSVHYHQPPSLTPAAR